MSRAVRVVIAVVLAAIGTIRSQANPNVTRPLIDVQLATSEQRGTAASKAIRGPTPTPSGSGLLSDVTLQRTKSFREWL
jgi:hypothetical protein